ncbi:uncharacterized protein BDR25DRAFT_38080 [Lindgomyces ingoldianus]|uniref:Uncharacterized protein n=1 Tax=Lindgomyces ingoldianus TaxID=673940 RepID=A0ACB6QT95_9PLEO|nr:uncharacterized protein BDR25DRAFT_38080 [Lindgomyces ingoldianus]KAF2470219.1 hypothetical protein BDR25DRAFT_38080 [Lindgomyces ingoldianus]
MKHVMPIAPKSSREARHKFVDRFSSCLKLQHQPSSRLQIGHHEEPNLVDQSKKTLCRCIRAAHVIESHPLHSRSSLNWGKGCAKGFEALRRLGINNPVHRASRLTGAFPMSHSRFRNLVFTGLDQALQLSQIQFFLSDASGYSRKHKLDVRMNWFLSQSVIHSCNDTAVVSRLVASTRPLTISNKVLDTVLQVGISSRRKFVRRLPTTKKS